MHVQRRQRHGCRPALGRRLSHGHEGPAVVRPALSRAGAGAPASRSPGGGPDQGRSMVDSPVRGAAGLAALGESFPLVEEAARSGDPDRSAARNRVPLRRRLLQARDRKPLGRVAEVDVGAGDQVARVIDVVSVRPVLGARHLACCVAPRQSFGASRKTAGRCGATRPGTPWIREARGSGRYAGAPTRSTAARITEPLYQPMVPWPMTPLLASPCVGISRRCASTPSSKFTSSRSSIPRA